MPPHVLSEVRSQYIKQHAENFKLLSMFKLRHVSGGQIISNF